MVRRQKSSQIYTHEDLQKIENIYDFGVLPWLRGWGKKGSPDGDFEANPVQLRPGSGQGCNQATKGRRGYVGSEQFVLHEVQCFIA